MLARWDPFGEIDRLTSRLFGERRMAGFGLGAAMEPAVDVFETDDAIELVAEVPGMKQEDVHIDLRENVLTLSGERRLENEETREGYKRIERTYGRFERSFTLPRNVDAEHIQAELANGVLRLKLPKHEEEKTRTIEVKAVEAKGEKKLEKKVATTSAPAAKA